MIRGASHAGTWYSASPKTLEKEFTNWIKIAEGSVGEEKRTHPNAIIVPHAGYSYCGSTGAYAFSAIDRTKVSRVFVLGPSHHVSIDGCALTKAKELETPFGNLIVDVELNKELEKTGRFTRMSKDVDEEEHSIEMELPYLAFMLKGADNDLSNVTFVEILVGSMDMEEEKEYGAILAPYFADPTNLFVISSDFCHWGVRFGYQPYDKSKGEVWQSIEAMDKEGVRLIEEKDHLGFNKYLKRTQNTICGRHPLGILLGAMDSATSLDFSVKFLNYTQSSKNKKITDSSVSYASAVILATKKGR